jgi:hypothetical protein
MNDARLRSQAARMRVAVADAVRRSGAGLRSISGPSLVGVLCAAAVTPVVAAGVAAGPLLVAGAGVLGAVGANVLADVVQSAIRRIAGDDRGQPDAELVERAVAAEIEAAFGRRDAQAAALRADVARVLREIDAVGAALGAVEDTDRELQSALSDALVAVAAEFAEFEIVLADLRRGVWAIDERLRRQEAALRAGREQLSEQGVTLRLVLEKVSAVQARIPVSAGDGPARHDRWPGCPYVGLAPFSERHASVFYGRRALTGRLLQALAQRLSGDGGVLAVVGASGAGKSSLLRAGLVREAFLAVLREAVTGEDARGGAAVPAVLVVAIRSDFLDAAAGYPFLRTAVQAGPFLVGPMSEQELRAAITGPAAEAGTAVETGLVDAVLHDLRDTATTVTGFGVGALPLLSQAMFNTWQQRDGGGLTELAYRRAGGVGQAVQTSAEQAYQSLTPGQRDLARTMLTRLTVVTRDGTLTRRPATRAELTTIGRADPPEVNTVVAAFTANRLLVTSNDNVEIAHDVLLRAWPRLGDWLDGDRDDRALYNDFLDDAADWDGAASASADRTVRLWELNLLVDPAANICRLYGSPNQDEWRNFAPGEPYFDACK